MCWRLLSLYAHVPPSGLRGFKLTSLQIYGFAFLFVGLAGPINNASRTWLQNVGVGLYSFASSSGSIFFSLNFGDEGMHQSFQKVWTELI
jgi:hypothetical protein